MRRPECSRCVTKAIECHYPASTPKGTGSGIQHNDEAPPEQRKLAHSLVVDTPDVEGLRGVSNDGDSILDSTLAISDMEFANLGGEPFDWNDPDSNFADVLDLPTIDETMQYSLSETSSLVRYPTPQTNQVRQICLSPKASIPTHTLRSLVPRANMGTRVQPIENLILHTLKSYPLMMMRHKTLPPFIHPHLISSDVRNPHMESLNNCISLMHMISSGIQGSRKLFWKNVRLECERLCEEVCWVCDIS